ncbi:hypothetical protein ACL02S_16010 [Nocardia sp. 004]|uniref:hypothetical protein n=1 Tax=Nocardia sp. 004 TaxID=3385978 RepID=UPI0039A186FE
MITIAQLQAVLSILRIDPDVVGVRSGDPAPRDPNTERMLLAGLLHRVAGSALRQIVTSATDDEAVVRAVTMSTVPLRGENPTEQVLFDAHWLHDRIGTLAECATVDPVPVLLDAAARAVAAAEALLLLSRNPRGDDADTRWEWALDDLGHAYHLINDERVGRSNTVTAPL